MYGGERVLQQRRNVSEIEVVDLTHGLEEIDIGRQCRINDKSPQKGAEAANYQETPSAYSYGNIVMNDMASNLAEFVKENQFFHSNTR